MARRRVRRGQAVAASLLVALVSWAAFGPSDQPDPLPAELDLVRMTLGLLAAPAETLTIPVDERSKTAIRRVPCRPTRWFSIWSARFKTSNRW